MTVLIDGKKIANEIKQEIASEVELLKENKRKVPYLAAILVGNNPASKTYVMAKEKACKSVGIKSTIIDLNENISQKELLQNVEMLNQNKTHDGFIVQLPLPNHISTQKIIENINPIKDVDGFHPMNIGKMVNGLPSFLPATPKGIMELLKRYKISTEGKHCVILGRSNIVGTPLSIMLSRKSPNANCTVTLCHSKTKNIKKFIEKADILIAALGIKHFITADMVKKNAIIIDVGIHRIKSNEKKSGYKLVGDVDFENVYTKCSYITPVPGGVGPMTIVSLLSNTLQAAKINMH